MTRTATIPRPTTYPDPSTLRRVFIKNPQGNYEYYEDARGSLYYKTDNGKYVWAAMRGRWLQAEDPAKPAPESMPTGLSERFAPDASTPKKEKARRRFAFTFPAQLSGVPGELTIEADTLKEAKDTLEEVKLTAKKYPHLGIVVGMVTKPEDEYFILLADGTAFCRKHQAPMSKRMKQGDEWWSHNAGTEASPCYCRGRPGHDSPGWKME